MRMPCFAPWHSSRLVALCLALTTACATAPPPGAVLIYSTTDQARSGDPTARAGSRLTSADLSTVVDGLTTIEAIRRLRPEFLIASRRNGSRATEPTVYVDGIYEGELSRLNSIPRSAIREVTFLHPTEAGMRFGIMCRCPGGVLDVRTRVAGK